MKTPQQSYPQLAKALGLSEIYLKREDLHKFKSHKGRSIPFMIKNYVKGGIRDFVISSSGNAGLAGIMATEQHNKNNPDKRITLRVFVGNKIEDRKLMKLKESKETDAITIEQVEKPKQMAFQIDKDGSAKSLRQSTDNIALEGYIPLAQELVKIPNLCAVFIPTSSGTSAEAIAKTFVDLEKPIQIHIAQTTASHPIAEEFDNNFEKTDKSLAGAIVDNVAHRKSSLVGLIKNTSGAGWVINDEEIRKAQKLVRETTKLSISTNSALGIAGIMKATKSGWKCNGPVACVISGQ